MHVLVVEDEPKIAAFVPKGLSACSCFKASSLG